MLIVEVLVVLGLILGPVSIFYRHREALGTAGVISGVTAGCLGGWLLLSFVGLCVAYCASSSTNLVGQVVSIKVAQVVSIEARQPPSVIVLIKDGNNVRSFQTARSINLEETQGDQVVAEISWTPLSRPNWWPRVLSLAIEEERVVGQPLITIKGSKDKLGSVLTEL